MSTDLSQVLIVFKFLIVSYVFRYLLERFEKSLYFFFQQSLSESFKTDKSPEQNLNSGLLASALSVFSKTLIALNWSYFNAGFVKKRRAILFLGASSLMSGALLFIFLYLNSYSFFLVAMAISLVLHLLPRQLFFLHELKSLLMTFSLLTGFFALLPKVAFEIDFGNLSQLYLWGALCLSCIIIGSFTGTLTFLVSLSFYQPSLSTNLYLIVPIIQIIEFLLFFKLTEESDYKNIFSKLYTLKTGLSLSFMLVFISLGIRNIFVLYLFPKLIVLILFASFSKKIWERVSRSMPKNARHQLSLPDSYYTLAPSTLIHLSEGHVFKTSELVARFFQLSLKHIGEKEGAARSLAKVKEYENIIDRMTSELEGFLRMILTKRMSESDVRKTLYLSALIHYLEALSDHLDKICSYYSQYVNVADRYPKEVSEELIKILRQMNQFFRQASESHFCLSKDEIELKEVGIKECIFKFRESYFSQSKALSKLSYRLSEMRRDLKKISHLEI